MMVTLMVNFSVVVWDIAKKEAICGHQAQVESAGITYCVAFSNRSDDVFVTGGEYVLKKNVVPNYSNHVLQPYSVPFSFVVYHIFYQQ
jgi:DNA-directed RNA polymerase subunit E'/Rpb7